MSSSIKGDPTGCESSVKSSQMLPKESSGPIDHAAVVHDLSEFVPRMEIDRRVLAYFWFVATLSFCFWLFSILSWKIPFIYDELLPFQNVSFSHEDRVNDLLSRLTEQELVQQLMHGGAGPAHGPAPPIPRLRIGPYQWRSECLHGYGFDGNATSFPMVISLAASFDRDMFHAVANATAFEGHAKFNSYVRNREYEDHKGINCFSPVVNILRHPLWGRNQETLGEDPFLTGELSNAFVRGLSALPPRGSLSRRLLDEEHVYLTTACCKHFAVHSGPENVPVSRLSFEANVSAADLFLTYLPAFKACLANGAAQSVMCSYNGINGVPNCANKWLLTDVLRGYLGFKGFVISDEGALQFLVSEHKTFKTFMEAARNAFEAGANIENSVEVLRGVYSTLPFLVAAGVIKRYQLEAMNRPLFLTRMRQAEFDPPEYNVYASLNKDDFIQCARHRQLSLIAGCRSAVLLKNTKNFLPLPRKVGSLALVGPFARSLDELLGSYPARRMRGYETTLEEGLQEIADKVYAQEFCRNGALCNKSDDEGLINLLTSTHISLIILTVGTGSERVAEHRDATKMDLLGQQHRMLQIVSIYAPNVPVVVLVYSASPVNISDAVESPQVQSILWFGYPGQETGQIAARIMLANPGNPYHSDPHLPGALDEVNLQHIDSFPGLGMRWGFWWIPAARLPFTWYSSLQNLPDITDYDVKNHTYRFIQYSLCPKNDTPCLGVEFPFGFGLTYNRNPSSSGEVFSYRNLDLPTPTVSSLVGFSFTVEVANKGLLPADEVVQVYMDWIKLFDTKADEGFGGRYKAAYRQLVGFRRVSLFPGESRNLRFYISPEQLTVWSFESKAPSPLCPANAPRNGTRCGSPVAGRGTVRLSVGGQQPLQSKVTPSKVIIALVMVMDHV